MSKLFNVQGNINGVLVNYAFDNPIKRDDFISMMYQQASLNNVYFSHNSSELTINDQEKIQR